jgi:predicted lipoprotein
MPDLSWQALYSAALSESDPIKLTGRVEAARRAIRQRLIELDESGDTRERQQLDDAQHALFTLAARRRSA